MMFYYGNLLLLCCGNFCILVRKSFYKILLVRQCKRLGTTGLKNRN